MESRKGRFEMPDGMIYLTNPQSKHGTPSA